MSNDTTMDSVQGQQFATQIIANIRTGHENPDYLHQVIDTLPRLSPGFRRAFLRQLQKTLEQSEPR